jgi:hypothetical protein
MSKLRMELTVAGLAALGFAWVFVLHFYGWSPIIVNFVLYATVFMAGFLGSWLGLGARKLNLWQSIGVASAAVLLVMAARG